MNLRHPAQARRATLTTVERLDRLLTLAIESMYRAEPGTDARRIRTERQASIALWLMHVTHLERLERQEGSAA